MPFDPSTAQPSGGGFDPNTAQLAQQPAPQSQPQQPGGENMGSLYAVAHGLEDTATFGLGDRVAAGMATTLQNVGAMFGADKAGITASPKSYGENLSDIRNNAATTANANPLSALTGDAAGLVTGGGALARGAELAGKAIPALGRAGQVLQLQQGQPLLNVARSAAVGGGFGAADAAGHGGNADQILLSGAEGAALGPVAGKATTAIAKALSPAADRAMRLLADKIGETPEVLQNAFNQFRQSTGRSPNMAEIMGLKSQGELRQVAAGNPTIGETMAKSANDISTARGGQIANSIEQQAGPAQNINALTSARTARMDATMDPIRGTVVPIDSDSAKLLADPRIRTSFAPGSPLRSKLADIVENEGGELTVKDVDQIRQAVRGRQAAYANPQNGAHNPHTAGEYGDLADSVSKLGTDVEPRYGQALDQYQRDSHYIRGFQHGDRGRSIGEADNPEMINSLNTQEGRQGYSAGVVSRLTGQAQESPAGAARVAQALSRPGNTQQQAQEAFGLNKAQQLTDAASAHAQSAQAMNAISPRTIAPEDEHNGGADLAHALAAATYHSPATALYHAGRAVTGFLSQTFGGRISPQVQGVIARYLSDPKMTQQGINLLKKAGASNEDFRRLAVAVSGATGITAARANGAGP